MDGSGSEPGAFKVSPEDREVVEAMDADADVGQVGRAVRV